MKRLSSNLLSSKVVVLSALLCTGFTSAHAGMPIPPVMPAYGAPSCTPQSDICVVQQSEVERQDLPDLYPFYPVEHEEGEGYYCQLESCYDYSGNFLGLNPFYYDY